MRKRSKIKRATKRFVVDVESKGFVVCFDFVLFFNNHTKEKKVIKF